MNCGHKHTLIDIYLPSYTNIITSEIDAEAHNVGCLGNCALYPFILRVSQPPVYAG